VQRTWARAGFAQSVTATAPSWTMQHRKSPWMRPSSKA
jgi:hypothetical protein